MNILLIGCGVIGLSLLEKWQDFNARILVIQPSLKNKQRFECHHSIEFIPHFSALPEDFNEDLCVLAIKPQMLDQIIPFLKKRKKESLIVSLLAGVSLKKFLELMPEHSFFIRMMPNIFIKKGESINLVFSSKNVKQSQILFFEKIFRPTGSFFWMKRESDLDNLTVITGSGPAYFFLLAQHLYEEVLNLGFSENFTKKIMDEVFVKTASLVQENKSYEDWITDVASKKGVTEAALEVMRPEIKKTIHKAIQAALMRLESFK